jgi:DNA-binding transcriptional LysR family regulator
MELRHLRYFVAVVDAGGVSPAATRLAVSQPALSRQIRDLESELGVSLFDRRVGRLVLTGEGADLLALSRDLLARAASLRERADALRGGEAGIIRVGVAPLTLESLLPPFLAGYRRRYPKVDVRLVEDSPGGLWTRLERGELNLAISFPGHAGLSGRLLFPVCAIAVMSSDHRLARRATLDVSELSTERLLLPGPQYLTRRWFDAACQQSHLRPNVSLESAAPHALIALAKVGYGTAIVPSHIPFNHRGLAAARVAQDGRVLGAWAAIAWDPHRFQPAFVEQFVDELARYSRDAYPGSRHIGKRNLIPR